MGTQTTETQNLCLSGQALKFKLRHYPISEYAIRQLKKMNKQMVPSLKAAIADLAHNPRPHNHIKLTNQEAYCVRVGNYRIIYEINDGELTVLVVEVADRKQVYKRK